MLSIYWMFFAVKIVLCTFGWPATFCALFPYMANYLGLGLFHIFLGPMLFSTSGFRIVLTVVFVVDGIIFLVFYYMDKKAADNDEAYKDNTPQNVETPQNA